jgi:hypothetical protein
MQTQEDMSVHHNTLGINDSFSNSSTSDTSSSTPQINSTKNTNLLNKYTMAEQMEAFLELDQRVSEDKRMLIARPSTPTPKFPTLQSYPGDNATKINREGT